MTQPKVIIPKHTKMKRLPDGTYREALSDEKADTELLHDVTDADLNENSRQFDYFGMVPQTCPHCKGTGKSVELICITNPW